MSFKKFNSNLQTYIIICFSLLLCYWLIGLYEIFSMLFIGRELPSLLKVIGFKFLNRLLTILFVFVIFYPIYFLLSRKKLNIAVITIKVLFILLILSELPLTKYSLTTLLNLGADLLGYSLDDIMLTVTSSESALF